MNLNWQSPSDNFKTYNFLNPTRQTEYPEASLSPDNGYIWPHDVRITKDKNNNMKKENFKKYMSIY